MKAKLSQQLITVKNNQVVVAVLARINTIYLFTWRGKEGQIIIPEFLQFVFISDLLTDNESLVSPYQKFSLPFPSCEYTHPCLSLTSSSLLVARKGTNVVHRLSVWDDTAALQ